MTVARWREFVLAVRLSRRLAAPQSRAEALVTTWLVVSTAVTLTAIFLLMGMLSALGHRSGVLEAREPVTASSQTPGPRTLVVNSQFNVGGARLNRLLLGPNRARIDLPPGIDRWPAPGQVLLSPGAQRLMARNAYAAALGQGEVVGRIGSDALRDRAEAYVVRGMSEKEIRATGFASPIARIGADSTVFGDLSLAGAIKAGALALSALAGSVLVLLSSVTRSSTRSRQRRLAVLQLIGAPSSVVRRTVGVTATCWAVLGAVVAVLLHPLLSRELAESGIASVRWWPDDARLAPALTVVIAGLAVVAIGWSASRSVAGDPWTTRRNAPPAAAGIWRLGPLLVGTFVLGGILVSQLRASSSGVALPGRGQALLLGGVLAVLLGGALASPVITRAAARTAARLPSLALRVGAARAAHHARASARIGASMMVLVMAAGMALAVWSIAGDKYQPEIGGRLTLTVAQTEGVAPEDPSTMTWQREFVADLLRDPDLVAALAMRNSTTATEPEELTEPARTRADDTEYYLVLPAAAAIEVAATIERAHPGTQEGVISLSLDGPQAVLLGNAAMVLALSLSALLIALCLAVSLVGLQSDRNSADTVLLLTGMSRRRLGGARVVEVVLTSLPPAVTAAVVAGLLAETVSRVDDPSITVPGRGFLVLALPVAALLALVVVAALAATPKLDPNRLRRD